jgi:cyanate permease
MDWRVWLVALPYLLANTGGYAYIFWGPTFIRDTLHLSSTTTGYVVAGIGLLSAVSMLGVSASSDRRHERFWHAGMAAMMVCVGAIGVAFFTTPVLRVAALALMAMGVPGFLSPYFCIPGMLFRGPALGAAIALVNSVGNLGGFIGPNVIGTLVTLTGSNEGAYLALGGLAFLGAAICIGLKGRLAVAS